MMAREVTLDDLFRSTAVMSGSIAPLRKLVHRICAVTKSYVDCPFLDDHKSEYGSCATCPLHKLAKAEIKYRKEDVNALK